MKRQSLSDLIQALRRLLKRNLEDTDPYVRVRVPVRKGPSDRSAAVALKEPGE